MRSLCTSLPSCSFSPSVMFFCCSPPSCSCLIASSLLPSLSFISISLAAGEAVVSVSSSCLMRGALFCWFVSFNFVEVECFLIKTRRYTCIFYGIMKNQRDKQVCKTITPDFAKQIVYSTEIKQNRYFEKKIIIEKQFRIMVLYCSNIFI